MITRMISYAQSHQLNKSKFMMKFITMKSQTLQEMRSNISSSDRKSTRLNSSHDQISYAVFCLKKKKTRTINKHLTKRRCPRKLRETCIAGTLIVHEHYDLLLPRSTSP